jgi:ABC-type lipoprotein release transport system permease subunit
VILLASAILAVLVPTRRAAAVDAVRLLRTQ